MNNENRKAPRLLYICDWLPPDFGAVGQYSELFAREMAKDGMDVVLGGFSSKQDSVSEETPGSGRLKTIRLHVKPYQKDRFVERLLWTAKANTRLVRGLWSEMRKADEILFTGSPPLFLHWIAPLNVILRKRLIYRITDFHPECLMAARAKPSPWLNLLYKLTLFWRRRVDIFEVLGEDQRRRISDIGIPPERIRLKRDPSPVEITPATLPLARPAGAEGKLLLLYSGNWGVAHDYETFIEGYRLHHEKGSARFVLWLNAVGSAAAKVEAALTERSLPFVRGTPVKLEQLASLLVTPDAHLITLLDPFVGFVLPSKVYGCIASGKPVLYIGDASSDVYRLCKQAEATAFENAPCGDVMACFESLERLADPVARNKDGPPHASPATGTSV